MSEIRPSDSNALFSNKLGFVVGFAAVLVALYPLKGDAESIPVILLNFPVSLYSLIAIFLGLLIFSLYLYALNYIRYDFSIFLSFSYLKYLEVFANFCYSIAITFPLFVFVVWLISLAIQHFQVPEFKFLAYISIFVALYLEIRLLIDFFEAYDSKEKDLVEEYKRKAEELSIRAEQENPKVKVLQYYQAVIAALESVLIKRVGVRVEKYPPIRIFMIAKEYKVITVSEYLLLKDLHGLRNIVAHDVYNFTPVDLEPFFEKLKGLLLKLQDYEK